eukprot:1310320-Rhodomonas_salina.1
MVVLVAPRASGAVSARQRLPPADGFQQLVQQNVDVVHALVVDRRAHARVELRLVLLCVAALLVLGGVVPVLDFALDRVVRQHRTAFDLRGSTPS